MINEYLWLKEVDSCLLRCSIFNLDNAYQKYFKENNGLPKFRSKTRSRQSYHTNNITSNYKGKTYNSIELDLNKKIIKLSKLKEVDIKGYHHLKQINGKIIPLDIRKGAHLCWFNGRNTCAFCRSGGKSRSSRWWQASAGAGNPPCLTCTATF